MHRLRAAAMSVALLIFAACTFSVPCQAQQAPENYQALADKFFEMLQKGKGADGVDFLISTNPSMKRVQDQMEQVRTQFAALPGLMGDYRSRQLLVESKAGDMFVYQHYIVAYDRQPISVRLTFYKPGDRWLCYGIQFDGNIDDLIKKSADERLQFKTK